MSDSHGNAGVLRNIALSQSSAEVFIHLGDGEQDFMVMKELRPDRLLRSVRGNSDWGSSSKLMDMLMLERKRILFAHGHTFQVKQSEDMIIDEARLVKADVVLFGHTHLPMTNYVDGIYLLNPGSVSQPRYGKPTYGIVDITEAGIITRIIQL